jgi:hypothetical protein
MLLFRSEEHISRWTGPRGAVLPLSTAWRLAQAWFGVDRRLPEWRRRTPDEIRELFDSLGLTGDFWRLS